MRRDSDDIFEWHRPTSAKDAVELIYYNFLCGCLICLLWTGAAFFIGVFKGVRTCCGLRKPHLTKDDLENRRRKEQEPIPLPQRRKRALTIPLSPAEKLRPWVLKQLTQNQSNSSFICNLPFEIRQLIYQHVIYGEEQGKVFHVYKNWKKMNYWQCRRTVDGLPCPWNRPCSQALSFNGMIYSESGKYRYTSRRNYNPFRVEKSGNWDGGAVSLIRTCRQIYSEAIVVLYSAHFHFPYAPEIVPFSRTILPQRLQSIKFLSLDWTQDGQFGPHNHDYDGFESKFWELAWDILSEMKGLRELRVYVKMTHVQRMRPVLERSRHMMKQVKGLKVFELVIPTPQISLWDDFIEPGMEITLVSTDASIVD